MSFFSANNPIPLFLALVITAIFLKFYLAKHKWFQKDKATYIMPVLIIAIIILLGLPALLKTIAIGIPYMAMVAVFLFGVGAIMLVFGMKQNTIKSTLENLGLIKISLYITIICIAAFALSQVFGESMLTGNTITISEGILQSEGPKEVDYSILFSQQALGMTIIFAVMGIIFYYVNMNK